MRYLGFVVPLIGLGVLGALSPAVADCRPDVYACLASSNGHPHICDPLVRNLHNCVAAERRGEQQASIDSRMTRERIQAVFGK